MKLYEITGYGAARAAEHAWGTEGAGPRQTYVKTRGGKRYGPFRDDEVAKQFIRSRTDLGPGAVLDYA